MQRLARYALLGWILFGGTALAFVVLAVVAVSRTPPILAVNRAGTVLGRIQWLAAIHRSRRAIIMASMRFLRDYLSIDGATVVPDTVHALDMMAPHLQAATVAVLQKTAYIARVRAARLRSWVSFVKNPHRPRLIRRDGDRFLVRLSGVVHVILPDGRPVREHFTIILTEIAVARRIHDTSGILVTAITAS
ncbi:hypothetical protein [Acidiferrobacter sp.]|uniref:hypothetical protein n=1 Tax=Acidiferrobacter sp. TaxID=1872107 RepID=UPI00260C5C46|nr:hypothetical protein [Acidiferrobacter sp.]